MAITLSQVKIIAATLAIIASGYIGYCIIAFTVKVILSIVHGIIAFPAKVLRSIENVIWYIVDGIIAFPGKVLRSCFGPSPEQEELEALLNQIMCYGTTNNHSTSYKNRSNNHDHLKVKHSTQASAEAEVRRMTKSGRYEECERLNVYYNDEYEGWFVGRGWSEHSD